MKVTATELRSNVYRLLDQVISTGEVLEIERKGNTLKIYSQYKGSKLAGLKKRRTVFGDADSLHEVNFSDIWNGRLP